MSGNEFICAERGYLEKVYVDFLRNQHPTLEGFRAFAEQSFEAENFHVFDATESWSRDVRCCVMDKLSIPDIVRLSRTCKTWLNVIVSPSFNLYWQNRYVRFFRRHPPTGPIPLMVHVGRAKKEVPILWFDIYQYVWLRQQRGFYQKRSLRTFLENKKNCRIVSFPEIHGDGKKRFREAKLPIECFPQNVIKFMDIKEERISHNELLQIIEADVPVNPERHFIKESLPFLPDWYGWRLQNTPPGIFWTPRNPFFTEGQIFNYSMTKSDYSRLISFAIFSKPNMKALWEICGIVIVESS